MPKKTTKKSPAKKTAAKNKKRAVKTVDAPSKPSTSETMSIRKIANGYIVTRDSYNQKTGQFRQTETFTKKKPKLEIKI